MHNEILDSSGRFEGFDWVSAKNENDLRRRFDNHPLAVAHNIEIRTLTFKWQDQFKVIEAGLVNPVNLKYFEEVIEYYESTPFSSLKIAEISSLLQEIESRARANVREIQDLEAILVFLSVTGQSSKIWLPVTSGGEGLYNRLLVENTTFNVVTKNNECATNVLTADGVSAGAGFIIEAGVLAALGAGLCAPCAVAVVAGVGLNAAFASAATYLNSTACQEK